MAPVDYKTGTGALGASLGPSAALDGGSMMKKTIYASLALASIFWFLATFSLVTTAIGCVHQPSGPPLPAPSSTEGAVLNLYGTDPNTLDPGVSGDTTSHEYILQVFSGLVKLDENLERLVTKRTVLLHPSPARRNGTRSSA